MDNLIDHIEYFIDIRLKSIEKFGSITIVIEIRTFKFLLMSIEYLLDIIKFIYQAKNERFDLESMEYFKLGTHFPQIASLLLEKKIQLLKSNPKTASDDLSNFKKTLTFLRNQKVSMKSFYFYKNLSDKDKIEDSLLALIKATFFKMDTESVFDKSRTILKKKKVSNRYNSKEYIFSGKFLLTLLHVVTNGEVAIPKRVNDISDFDKLIVPNFQKANVPLVIDRNSFDIDKPQRFLIQVQIIFMIFSKEIEEIELDEEPTEDIQSEKPKNIKKAQTRTLLATPKQPDASIASPSSQPNFFEKDSYYKDDDIHLNIVNSLINDQSQRIDYLYQLFIENEENKGLNKLFSFVQNFFGEKMNLGNGSIDTKVKAMLSFLSNRYPKHQKFFTEFQMNLKGQQKIFIDELLSCYFEEERNLTYLKNVCKAIFYDYQIEFKDFDQFCESNGLLFLPLLQRLSLKEFSDIDLINYPLTSDLTLPELHRYFKLLNIPFIFIEDSFKHKSSLDTIPYFQHQTKLILDQFDKNYLDIIVRDYIAYSDKEVTPLLKTINAIGARKGIHFRELESVIDGTLLPCLIECLLQKSLNDQIQLIKSPQLTEEDSEKNIETVIQFLKSQKSKFNVLLFDFKDPKRKRGSVKTLCKNLITVFFLKKSRKELLDRCDSILSTKTRITSIEDFRNGKPFFALLYFMMNYNIHFNYDDFKHRNFSQLKEDFQKVRIPMVIDEACFENPALKESIIFYQLQFIFDKLDFELHKKKPSLVVTELFLDVAKQLKNVEILCSRVIKDSAVAKQNSPENCLKFLTEKNIDKIPDTKEEPKSFDIVLNKLRKDKKEIEDNSMNLVESKIIEKSDMLLSWNPDDGFFVINSSKVGLNRHLLYEDGSLILGKINNLKKIDKSFDANYSKKLITDLDKFFKLKRQSKKEKNKPEARKPEKQEKIYKIFVYDTVLKKWKFNLDDFKSFVKDKKLDEHDTGVPKNVNLISFINSHEEDLISLNSIYLNDAYPYLGNDELFVYALCHNYGSSSIPIYLLLHVPENQIKSTDFTRNFSNISSAITQIYSYLYSISDFKIVLLNVESDSKEKNIYNQIETTKIIDNISKSISIDHNNNSKLILLANRAVPKYESNFCENMESKGIFKKFLKDKQFPEAKIIPAGFEFTNSESDFVFRDMINEMSKNCSSTWRDVCAKLQNYPQYQISGTYMLMKSQLPQDINLSIEGFIKFRLELKDLNDSKPKLSDTDKMLILLDEFTFFTPQNDNDFNQRYRTIIYNRIKESPNMINELSNKLESASEELISILNHNIIFTKLYWENQQISIIRNSYFLLLDEVFYNIIFICKFGRLADIIYQDLHNILDKQKIKDQKKIESSFEKYIIKITERNKEVTKDLKKDIIKSTKYVMKETENLKDREVLVGIGQQLEDVIDQDF